jgi:hypothetical protein
MNQRALEQAIRALTLVLQAGTIGLAVLDVSEAPSDSLHRLPFTTWLRLQRMVEGRQTMCVLVGSEPMARSSAGLTVKLAGQAGQAGPVGQVGQASRAGQAGQAGRFSGRMFDGLNVEARVVRARTRLNEDAVVSFATAVANHV